MLPDAGKAKYRKRLKLHEAEVLKGNERFTKGLSQEQLKDCFVQEASLKKKEDDSSVDYDFGHDVDDNNNDDVDVHVQTVTMIL